MKYLFEKAVCAAALLIMALAMLPAAAYANTDGSEIQITEQPYRLILQLGPEWAGTEFELRTDAGVFPAPVVVDYSGVLKMDLGGSKTYILSCISSGMMPVPVSVPATENASESTPESPAINDGVSTPEPAKEGIPTLHLVLFVGGLTVAVGGLLAMWLLKQRREAAEYADDEYYEDE